MRSLTRLALALSFALLLAGVIASPAARATTHSYKCSCLGDRYVGRKACGPRGPESATLRLTTTTAAFAYGSTSESFRHDPTYHQGGAQAGYVRYIATSRALLLEKALQTGGYALQTGGKGGFLHYTSRGGDGYDNVRYICRAQ
jgi:hypothetical protein